MNVKINKFAPKLGKKLVKTKTLTISKKNLILLKKKDNFGNPLNYDLNKMKNFYKEIFMMKNSGYNVLEGLEDIWIMYDELQQKLRTINIQ